MGGKELGHCSAKEGVSGVGAKVRRWVMCDLWQLEGCVKRKRNKGGNVSISEFR